MSEVRISHPVYAIQPGVHWRHATRLSGTGERATVIHRVDENTFIIRFKDGCLAPVHTSWIQEVVHV